MVQTQTWKKIPQVSLQGPGFKVNQVAHPTSQTDLLAKGSKDLHFSQGLE